MKFHVISNQNYLFMVVMGVLENVILTGMIRVLREGNYCFKDVPERICLSGFSLS